LLFLICDISYIDLLKSYLFILNQGDWTYWTLGRGCDDQDYITASV